jgi:hypothetical protein
MGYINVTQGVTISVPTSGTRNWASNLLSNAWSKISAHDHTGSGKGLQIVTAALANLAITSAKLAKNLAGTQATTVTQALNAATLDFDNGNIQRLSLVGATGAVSVTLSNPQTGGVYKIWITQAASVTDITWPVSVLWPQGVKYGVDVSQGASQIDCVTLYYNGTNYLGDWQLNWS